MSKTDKETAILEGIKKLPKSRYGSYHYMESLEDIIGAAMGYEAILMPGGRKHWQEIRTILKIADRMEAKGIIKRSASGNMFKLIKD